MYGYGDRLLREKKLDSAKQIFEKMTMEHADTWQNWYGLARAQMALGGRAAAKAGLEAALSRARHSGRQAGIRRMLDRLAAGQTIG